MINNITSRRQLKSQKMSGYLNLNDLHKIAHGLNIEGYRPATHLPPKCKWYNVVQVIDNPLEGHTWNQIMEIVNANKYELIEESIGLDCSEFLSQLTTFINLVKSKHSKILIHVHQYSGTTVLNQLIQDHTGVLTILDKTNFYNDPVIYSEMYPDIDALVSISQCAGFGLEPGTFIIPNQWMEFDVENNIIFTTPVKNYHNNALDLFPFEHRVGALLMVNDLWNPPITQTTHEHTQSSGVLMLDAIDRKVFDFCRTTMNFDKSHDWHHAIDVAYDSTKIRNTKKTLYLALLHDVCDHKYPDSIPREDLSNFIMTELNQEYHDIDILIEQVSYSHQKTKGSSGDPDLDAVRDGDRKQAIGFKGVERCIIFTQARGGKVPEDVVKHCFDKLLRLLPEHYIVTEIGRRDALDDHNYVVTWVRNNLPLTNLKYELPEYLTIIS